MKTNVIIAEAVVGKSIELTITDMIVLNSKKSQLSTLLDKNVKSDYKRDSIHVDTKLLQDIVNLLSKLTDETISLEQSEKDLFEPQNEQSNKDLSEPQNEHPYKYKGHIDINKV